MNRKTRVSERLTGVTTEADLHTILSELAADPNSRWTRTQILFYLPRAFHSLAEEYFIGERLNIPRRSAVQVEPVDLVPLDIALAELEEFATENSHRHEGALGNLIPAQLEDCALKPPQHDNDILGNVAHALFKETLFVAKTRPKRFRLRDGRCVGVQEEKFIYAFAWSSEPELFQPGRLRIGDDWWRARVGRQGEENDSFELLVDDYISHEIGKADFYVDHTFLNRAQLHWLNKFREMDEHDLVDLSSLFQAPHSFIEGAVRVEIPSDHLNDKQREAISIVRAARVSYVWGPPGTGKTTTLGALVRLLVNEGERILVLSPYNVAVDQAVEAITRYGEWREGQVVRFGRISERIRDLGLDLDSLLDAHAARSGLLRLARRLYRAAAHNCGIDRPVPATVRGCIQELGEMMVGLGRVSGGQKRPTIGRIRGGIDRIKRLYRSREASIIDDASVIGTTVALSHLIERIYEGGFDRVIIDEASVFRTPEALLAALIFKVPIAFFGDPKQLPAVVEYRSEATDRWVKPNPFEMAKIRGPRDAQGACVMLDEQHRMAPPIRSIVSDLFYDGALKDAIEGMEGQVYLVDTSETPARASTRWVRMGQSRHNQVHRDIVGSLLAALTERQPDATILVLAPFRAQVRAYQTEVSTSRFDRVRFETIHRGQGTEADIVILDLVAAPSRGRSTFLDENRIPELPNLLNVGISRTKSQFFLLAHSEEIKKQYPAGLINRLVQRVKMTGKSVLLPENMRLRDVWVELLDQPVIPR